MKVNKRQNIFLTVEFLDSAVIFLQILSQNPCLQKCLILLNSSCILQQPKLHVVIA